MTRLNEIGVGWMYTFLAVFVVAFCSNAITAVQRIRLKRYGGECPSRINPRTPYILIAFTSGSASYFICKTMFLGFHAFVVQEAEIQLVYCWPRPTQHIARSAVVGATIMRDRRGAGTLDIDLDTRSYRSIAFSKLVTDEVIRESFGAWRGFTVHRWARVQRSAHPETVVYRASNRAASLYE